MTIVELIKRSVEYRTGFSFRNGYKVKGLVAQIAYIIGYWIKY